DILLEVRALIGDEHAWLPLYSTQRAFDADALTLQLNAEDHATLDSFAEAQPVDGPLTIPTARDVRFTFTPHGRDDADYFESEAARSGSTRRHCVASALPVSAGSIRRSQRSPGRPKAVHGHLVFRCIRSEASPRRIPCGTKVRIPDRGGVQRRRSRARPANPP